MRLRALCLSTVLLLAGCTTDSAAEVDPETLDTGVYSTAPRDFPVNEETSLLAEATSYGEYLLMPYEVDTAFREGKHSGITVDPSLLDLVTSKPERDVVAALDTYLAGASYRGWDDDAERGARNAFFRFVSPEAARQAASAMAEARRADPSSPGETVEVPAYPEASAVRTRFEVTVAYPYEDFVLYAQMNVAPDIMGGTEPDLSWAVDYAEAFIGKQLPLLTEMPLWDTMLPLDPEGLLGYTVAAPEGRRNYVVPSEVSARQFSARYEDPNATQEELEALGVDVVAQSYTTIFRTRNASAAVEMVETYANTSGTDFTVYTEPQGLPSAVCRTLDTRYSIVYQCLMSNGRYVARAEIRDYYDNRNDDDARLELSRLMAAQFILLKQMGER